MSEVKENKEMTNEQAVELFNKLVAGQKDERKQCLEDRRFVCIAGGQYEGAVGEQFENRMKIEVNKLRVMMNKIISQYRNNRISVKYLPRDGSDRDASKINNLFRADFLDSGGEDALDNAFNEAMIGGIGAWRIRNEYENEYSFGDEDHQRIIVEPILDADQSVYFYGSSKQDKSDALGCFVLKTMTREDCKAELDEDPASWPNPIQTRFNDISTPDLVDICEHYVVETKNATAVYFENILKKRFAIDLDELKKDPAKLDEFEKIGTREVDRRKYKKRRVRKYIRSAAKLIKDCGYIAGSFIPVIVTYGNWSFIDGQERPCGHFRFSKDAQRVANAVRTMICEIAIKSPAEKPIFLPEQMVGHESLWQSDDLVDNKYLLVNPITDQMGNKVASGSVDKLLPPSIPPAVAALVQLSDQDVRDVVGVDLSSEKILSNVSGKAYDVLNQAKEMNADIYITNFAKAMKWYAKVYLSMAKEVYGQDKGRSIRGYNEENKPLKITMDDDFMSLLKEDLDVFVDVGPTSASAKAATAQSMSALAATTDDPEMKAIFSMIAALNSEGDIPADAREFIRKKLVALGVYQPNEKDLEEMEQQQQGPSSQDQLMAAMAEEATAKAAKARADTINSVADAELKSAKTAQTLTDIELSKQDQAAKVFNEIASKMGEIVQPPAQG